MSPRPWLVPGPGDEQAPCELEGPACPACGGSGIDEATTLRAEFSGVAYSPDGCSCVACEGTGYREPSAYWAACAAELGDL